MMLHGGTQDGADFAAATRLDGFADRYGFVVVYPEQITSANPMRYWNWFSPNDQRRGTGEPAILVDIVERIAKGHPVDRSRIYVAGFSAGAAMAAVLAATYPDVFAGACVHSGLPHGVASDLPSAFAAMKHPSPTRQVSHPVPMLVIHGDADRIVAPANGTAVIAQHAPSPTSDTVLRLNDGLSYSRRLVQSATGHRHEQWTVHGLGHAWSGGAAGASYTEPEGPNASAALVRFFGLDAAPTARSRPA
jgi:poly(hydroxyalkanoate) depolymerase family esterase